MTYEEIVKDDHKYIMQTYGRYPVAFARGEGAHLWDVNGKKYVDLLAGIAVTSLITSVLICRKKWRPNFAKKADCAVAFSAIPAPRPMKR